MQGLVLAFLGVLLTAGRPACPRSTGSVDRHRVSPGDRLSVPRLGDAEPPRRRERSPRGAHRSPPRRLRALGDARGHADHDAARAGGDARQPRRAVPDGDRAVGSPAPSTGSKRGHPAESTPRSTRAFVEAEPLASAPGGSGWRSSGLTSRDGGDHGLRRRPPTEREASWSEEKGRTINTIRKLQRRTRHHDPLRHPGGRLLLGLVARDLARSGQDVLVAHDGGEAAVLRGPVPLHEHARRPEDERRKIALRERRGGCRPVGPDPMGRQGEGRVPRGVSRALASCCPRGGAAEPVAHAAFPTKAEKCAVLEGGRGERVRRGAGRCAGDARLPG